MAMSGLSYFDNGGQTEEQTPVTAQVKPVQGKGPYAVGLPTGNVPLSEGVLSSMEQLYVNKMIQQQGFMEAMKDAAAWWSGGIEGPTAALSRRAKEREEQTANLFQLQTQIAQSRAAQEQAKRQAAELTSAVGGAEGPGAAAAFGVEPRVRNEVLRLIKSGDVAGAKGVYDNWFKTDLNETIKFLNNAASYKADVEIIDENGKYNIVSAIDAKRLFSEGKARPTGKTLGGTNAPAAAPPAAAPPAAAPPAAAPPAAAPPTAAPPTAAPPAAPPPPPLPPPLPPPEGRMQPVSVRNNNPGNLVDPRTGQIRKFDTPEQGQAALEQDLAGKLSGTSPAYKSKFGDAPVSPLTLAETWAPANAPGNSLESTTNYAKHIANTLGISVGDTIPNTPEALNKVAKAITEFESGQRAPSAPVQLAAAPGATMTDVSAPTTGRVPAPAAPAPVPARTTPVTRPTIPEARAAAEIEKTTEIKRIEALKEEDSKRIISADTAARDADDRLVKMKRMQSLVESAPSLYGLSDTPGAGGALIGAAMTGIKIGANGQLAMPGVEDMVRKMSPQLRREFPDEKQFKQKLAEVKEVASYLHEVELAASQAYKGQGQVSDYERKIVAAIAGSTSDPASLIAMKSKWYAMKAQNDKELGAVMEAIRNEKGDYVSFAAIRRDPRYQTMIQNQKQRANDFFPSDVLRRADTIDLNNLPAGGPAPATSGRPSTQRFTPNTSLRDKYTK